MKKFHILNHDCATDRTPLETLCGVQTVETIFVLKMKDFMTVRTEHPEICCGNCSLSLQKNFPNAIKLHELKTISTN